MRPTQGLAAARAPLRARVALHARRVASASILAAGLCVLLLLAGAAGLLPRHVAAATAFAAPFPIQPNASISLVSPSSGKGPVGATLTVQGSGWTANQVAIGAASSAAGCVSPNAGGGNGWLATLATASVSNGAFNQSFTWPSTLSTSATYALCAISALGGQPAATGGVAAAQTYTVRSSQPPTLSLSSSTVQVGQPFTITGSNFYGMPTINISINTVFNQSVSPDGSGSFIVTVTPTASQAGNANILAQSPPEGSA
ncbi:MAG: hypothetical protein ACRDHP_02960, partial [Ktedonobacterales bacterium]